MTKQENLRIRMGDMKLKNMNASWQDIYSVVNTAEYESYEKALNNKYI